MRLSTAASLGAEPSIVGFMRAAISLFSGEVFTAALKSFELSKFLVACGNTLQSDAILYSIVF